MMYRAISARCFLKFDFEQYEERFCHFPFPCFDELVR